MAHISLVRVPRPAPAVLQLVLETRLSLTVARVLFALYPKPLHLLSTGSFSKHTGPKT